MAIFNKRQLFSGLLVLTILGCSPNKGSDFKEPVSAIHFVRIPKGSFMMGDHQNGSDIKTSQKVNITKGFWMGSTEVTQAQWQKIMGATEPHPEKPSPYRNKHPNYPVVSVSYWDVELYLKKLNAISKDYHFRLPTEAEWEYACRAGTTGNFSFGNQLSAGSANFNAAIASEYSALGNFLKRPQPVGSYPANKWGLFDMHGNVWEWVADWYAPYEGKIPNDPHGPNTGSEKVIRGGSWYFSARHAKSTHRGKHAPDLWGFSIGFRLVCEKKN